MIETQNGAKKVHMSLKTVKGLTQLNSTENRKKHQYDKAFIKALLVDLIGIRQIKELGVDNDILKLIKSMLSEHLKKKSLIANHCMFYLQTFTLYALGKMTAQKKVAI